MRQERQPEYLRLTVERVRLINRWRMQFMVLYFGWFFVQTLVYLFAADGLSRNQILALGLVATALLLCFYVRFIQVLRAVGYSWLLIVPSCLLAILPIPGILIVVYLDRTIGKTFNRGMARAKEEAIARAGKVDEGAAEDAAAAPQRPDQQHQQTQERD